MSFTVLEPGIESRIVDLGRPRSRSLGVPVGGAADRRFLVLGNALVGNRPDAPALEITLKGPRLRALAHIGCCLFGVPFPLWRDGVGVDINHSFTLYAGEELHIGSTQQGVRAYLCVRGGFQAPTILRSRSALEPIGKGDELPCSPSVIRRRCPSDPAPFKVAPVDKGAVVPLAVLPGLQASWFCEAEFFQQSFLVTASINRMGLRLQGKPLTMPTRELVSEPVCPGSIQVTPDGQCIVLGIDGQTIGGYPKIAHVIQADIDLLAQLRPGQEIRFCQSTPKQTADRNRRAQQELARWALGMRLALDAFPD